MQQRLPAFATTGNGTGAAGSRHSAAAARPVRALDLCRTLAATLVKCDAPSTTKGLAGLIMRANTATSRAADTSTHTRTYTQPVPSLFPLSLLFMMALEVAKYNVMWTPLATLTTKTKKEEELDV